MDKANVTANVNETVTRAKDLLINFIVPIICISTCVALGFFIIYPGILKQPEIKSQIETSTTLRDQLKTKLDLLTSISDYNSVVLEDSNLVNDVLASEAQVPQLLTQIDMMARENGLEVTRLSYSYGGNVAPEGTPAADKTVAVSLNVQGNYAQFIDFLRLCENSARLVLVDTFRFGYGADSTTNSKIDVNISLISPYLYVESNAITDDPVKLNITEKPFLTFMEKLKNMKFYRIGLGETTTSVTPVDETAQPTPNTTTNSSAPAKVPTPVSSSAPVSGKL